MSDAERARQNTIIGILLMIIFLLLFWCVGFRYLLRWLT